MPETVLGIDFGTSCTSAGTLIGERVELVRDNSDPVIPTVVYLPDRGEIEVGRRAVLRQQSQPNRVVRSVKRDPRPRTRTTSSCAAIPPARRRSSTPAATS